MRWGSRNLLARVHRNVTGNLHIHGSHEQSDANALRMRIEAVVDHQLDLELAGVSGVDHVATRVHASCTIYTH